MTDKLFLPEKGNYRNLIVFQKAECIYDITYYFANKYYPGHDRTRDQMVQAARSGCANIAEAAAASATSAETAIKLTNVARASLQELLMDYVWHLRHRQLKLWAPDDPRTQQVRRVSWHHNDTAFYMERIPLRSEEVVANIAITLIHQEDRMLKKLIEKLQTEFVENGGIKEAMYRARTGYRDRR